MLAAPAVAKEGCLLQGILPGQPLRQIQLRAVLLTRLTLKQNKHADVNDLRKTSVGVKQFLSLENTPRLPF